jgi:hypothetical protein
MVPPAPLFSRAVLNSQKVHSNWKPSVMMARFRPRSRSAGTPMTMAMPTPHITPMSTATG